MMNAIEIKNLTKAYPGFLLDDVSLTLPNGCIMGLIGENGAGKTTLLKLILDMIRKDGGTVKLFGKDNRNTLLKEDIGVVTDEVGIPDCLTTKQVGNMMKHTFRHWDAAMYEGLIRRFALPDNKAFKDFSRGMKMKAGIAVALSHGSKLLILDEATSGLDPVARDEVVELFGEFTRDENHAILFSSHIVSDLEKLCDYVAFLHRGKLLLCEEKDILLGEYGLVRGTPEQLREIPENAIKHIKENPYGAEALVLRGAVPQGMDISPVSMEELFVLMAKEAR